jgi:dinuclear metal center YbgI/SA1388 family protein
MAGSEPGRAHEEENMQLLELVNYLDQLLRVKEIEDESPNGLQVEGRGEVHRAGFAVDYSPELGRQAATDGLDLLFVHHGLIWGSLKQIRGITLAYLKPLIQNEISLYVAHLPLDVHPELSHNVRMARMLGLTDLRPFGNYKGLAAGVIGRWPGPGGRDGVLEAIRGTISCDVHFLPFGSEDVSQVAIISGGGASLALQAREAGADFYLTGEPSHSSYFQIKTLGLNVCFAGHYLTEKWGVLSVMEHLQTHGLPEGRFYDIPSPF